MAATEGNFQTLKGGYRSPRVYNEVARQLVEELLVTRPDLRGYPEAVAGWAEAEAQCQLLRRQLAAVGSFDADGEPRSGLLRWLQTLENMAGRRRQELGLDPRSEAKLAKERALATGLSLDLAGLAAQGRAALAGQAEQVEHDDLAGQVLEAVTAAAAATIETTTKTTETEEVQP